MSISLKQYFNKGGDLLDFKFNLRYIREREGFTQSELAEKVGISQAALSNYENGKDRPSVDVCAKMAKALKVSIDDLVHGEKSKKE